MPTVELREQVQLLQASVGGGRLRRVQIQHRRAARAEFRAAMHRRQPAVLPQQRAVRAVAIGIAQHHVGRQILILRAERVAHPRAERRAAQKDFSRAQQHQRLAVVVVLAVHRAHERQLIRERGEPRQRVAHIHATLAAPSEAPRASEDAVGFAALLKRLHALAMRLAVELVEQRLRVEQIHLARPADLREKNDCLRAGRNIRGTRSERRSRAARCARQQRIHRQRAKAQCAGPQRRAARTSGKIGVVGGVHGSERNSLVLNNVCATCAIPASRAASSSAPASKRRTPSRSASARHHRVSSADGGRDKRVQIKHARGSPCRLRRAPHRRVAQARRRSPSRARHSAR